MFIRRIFVGHEDLRIQVAFDKIRNAINSALLFLVHNDLLGRSAASAHPAESIDVDTTLFHQNLGPSDNTVQKALVTLDLIGGGSPTFGSTFIRLPIPGTAGTFTSLTSIFANALLIRAVLVVEQPYDGGATIEVRLAGASPITLLATSENRPNQQDTFEAPTWRNIVLGEAGPIQCIVGGIPTTGQASVVVEFAANPAA